MNEIFDECFVPMCVEKLSLNNINLVLYYTTTILRLFGTGGLGQDFRHIDRGALSKILG